MDCNNIYCNWQSFNQCCHESEEGFANATPNSFDCKSFLSRDVERYLWEYYEDCKKLLRKRNIKELIDIYDFISGQRDK